MGQSFGFRSGFDRWFWFFSTIAAVLSFINFLAHALQLGVGPVLTEMLAFYRKIFYPAIDFLASLVSLRISQIAKDAFILAALTLSTFQTAQRGTKTWTAMGGLARVIFTVAPLAVASAIAWLVENELSGGLQVGPTVVGRFAMFVLALPISVVISGILIHGWFRGQVEAAWDLGGDMLVRYIAQLMVMVVAATLAFAVNWPQP